MVRRLLLLMGMLMHNNGFTLLETLLVLLIFSFCSFVYLRRPSWNLLRVEVHKLAVQCLQMQEKAYTDKREVEILFGEDSALFDGLHYSFPEGMICSSQSFHYNEKGNISKALSVSCQMGKNHRKLVFQLGTGRIREE